MGGEVEIEMSTASGRTRRATEEQKLHSAMASVLIARVVIGFGGVQSAEKPKKNGNGCGNHGESERYLLKVRCEPYGLELVPQNTRCHHKLHP